MLRRRRHTYGGRCGSKWDILYILVRSRSRVTWFTTRRRRLKRDFVLWDNGGFVGTITIDPSVRDVDRDGGVRRHQRRRERSAGLYREDGE